MNNARRRRIRGAVATFPARPVELLDRAEALREALEEIQAEEQEAFDALPEGLQSSPTGADMEDAIELLENAIAALDALSAAFDEVEAALGHELFVP